MMLDILHLYISSFWAWAGITFGMAVLGEIVCMAIAAIVGAFRK